MDSQETGGQDTDYSAPERGKRPLISIVLAVLLVASLAFGGWAYSKMLSYKNDSGKKTAAAVSKAEAAARQDQQNKDIQANKSPFKTFNGSPTYGSITFDYPKTWSAYVDNSSSSEPINGYFNPDTVPGLQAKAAYALRAELVSTDYTQVLQQFNSQITQGTVTSRAYLPPKLQGTANVVAGVYLTGQINIQDPTQTGAMVVLRVRDKTLQIYTESNSFLTDFNNTVLASLTFAP